VFKEVDEETKKYTHFSDETLEENKAAIKADIDNAIRMWDSGRFNEVVMPENLGRSQLHKNAN